MSLTPTTNTFATSTTAAATSAVNAGESPIAPSKLTEAAQQFEALFLQQVLKSMRKAGDVLAADALRSRELDTYRDYYDGVLAEQLASQKAVGIADMLERQLQGGVATAQTPSAAVAEPAASAIPAAASSNSLAAPVRAEWHLPSSKTHKRI